MEKLEIFKNKFPELSKKLPLRAYPEKALDNVMRSVFLTWLSGLLSLTDEVSAERLELALPAIKTQCIGMGFDEIKIMFEKYADGKMSLKPIPNYFDRILLGKIVNEYKSTKPKMKKEEISEELTEEQKQKLIDDGITALYLEYTREKRLSGNVSNIYDYLDTKGLLQADTKLKEWNEYKFTIFARAKKIAKAKIMTKSMKDISIKRGLKFALSNIENGQHDSIKPIAKRLVLEDYFARKLKENE